MFQVLDYQLSTTSPAFAGIEERFGKLFFYNDWKIIDKDKPILCEGNLKHDNVRFWLNNNYPVVYNGRGYLGNHRFKSRSHWLQRLSVNGWANTEIKSIPYDRWSKINLPRQPWKVKEVKRVLIAPSKMTTEYWTNQNSGDWSIEMLDKFPGAEVKIRKKGETPGTRWQTLWDDLDWADLVVSLSSAITVEAFWYGKKVISLFPCNTWAAGCERTLDDWKNPHEPELRDQWHEHLAWSQFTPEEINSGEAFSLIEKYLGPINSYQSGHTYNFKV
jgi:hypothetical protein